MKMLLLVSAVVLLVSAAVATPVHPKVENLKRIIDLAEKYNESFTQEFFVEDVSHLAQGNKCGDKFFCKVHHILHEHEHFGKRKEEEDIVRNLKIFISGKHPNCTELLKDETPSGVTKPIPTLVGYLTECIKKRNLMGHR